MPRVTFPILLMAAAVLPRVSGGPVRLETAPKPAPMTARALSGHQDAAPPCCGSPNRIARLLCLHYLALSQIAQSTSPAPISPGR